MPLSNWLMPTADTHDSCVLDCTPVVIAGRQDVVLELCWDVHAGPVVHFVGCLPMECRVRQMGVVLLDIESDLPPKTGRRVQRVEVQPLMFDYSPPGLDH